MFINSFLNVFWLTNIESITKTTINYIDSIFWFAITVTRYWQYKSGRIVFLFFSGPYAPGYFRKAFFFENFRNTKKTQRSLQRPSILIIIGIREHSISKKFEKVKFFVSSLSVCPSVAVKFIWKILTCVSPLFCFSFF